MAGNRKGIATRGRETEKISREGIRAGTDMHRHGDGLIGCAKEL